MVWHSCDMAHKASLLGHISDCHQDVTRHCALFLFALPFIWFFGTGIPSAPSLNVIEIDEIYWPIRNKIYCRV